MMNNLSEKARTWFASLAPASTHTFSRVSKPISTFASKQCNQIKRLLKCHP